MIDLYLWCLFHPHYLTLTAAALGPAMILGIRLWPMQGEKLRQAVVWGTLLGVQLALLTFGIYCMYAHDRLFDPPPVSITIEILPKGDPT